MALEEPLDSADFFMLPCWRYCGSFVGVHGRRIQEMLTFPLLRAVEESGKEDESKTYQKDVAKAKRLRNIARANIRQFLAYPLDLVPETGVYAFSLTPNRVRFNFSYSLQNQR